MPEKKIRRSSKRDSVRIVGPGLLTILLFGTAIFFILLPQLEESFLNRKKEMIRELTETVWSLLDAYHERELSGELTKEEAQKRAILRIGKLRYGPEKKDYFWINDMTPRLILHPYRPDLVGQDVSDFKDSQGKRLFSEFTALVRQQGEGYVRYMWQWKDDPNRVEPKISYIKGFSPWGWVVGTGLYVDDIHAEMQAIRKRLTAASAGILALVALLMLYSIRRSIQAHKEIQQIFLEREQLMQSLELSKERFRNLLETTSDWIWETDEKGRYTYSSPRIRNLLGVEPEEAIEGLLMSMINI